MKLTDPVKVMKAACKFASKDASRPILCAVHLDECGDVVSTDSYRMFVQHGAWEGESLDIEYAVAYAISKRKLKGNDFAELTVNGNVVKVKMGDGFEFEGNIVEGKYPVYKKLMPEKHTAVAYIDADRVLPVVREHVRLKSKGVTVAVNRNHLFVSGYGENVKPSVELAQASEGEGFITFDPKFLRDTLGIFKGIVDMRFAEPYKPAVFVHGDSEVLVMPIRTDATPKKQERKLNPTKATPDELRKAIHDLAIDRAANDPDSKVKPANASVSERNLVWEYERAGKLTRKEANSFTSWYLDGEFLVCIERRWSQREINLTHPELKPIAHRSDMVESVLAERAAKAETEKQEAAKKEEELKEIEALKKEIEALKAEAEKAKAETAKAKAEVEKLKAKPKAEPKSTKKAEPKAAKKGAEITLEFMQAWAKERGLEAKQKHPGTEDKIWVLGDSKAYHDELVEMGFRWAKRSKMGEGWYATPKAS